MGGQVTPIFTISSRGGSATLWLNTLLNRHPEVVSFHGFREDPFDAGSLLTPEKLADWLLVMRDRSAYETPDYLPSNSFGTVHTYWGSEPKDAFLSKGGSFTAILRDPVRRINSLFSHHYLRDVREYPDWRSRRVDYDGLRKEQEVRDSSDIAITEIQNDTYTPTEKWFVNLCGEILASDLDIATNCEPAQILRYEDLVGSLDGLKEGLSRVLNITVGDDYPGIANAIQRPVNTHAGTSFSSGDIFDLWPDKFKKVFFSMCCR